MIIDLILERKKGLRYSVRDFYANIVCHFFEHPLIVEPIIKAMDKGDEEIVIFELCRYILTQKHDQSICNYIRSVKWLKDDPFIDKEGMTKWETKSIDPQWKSTELKEIVMTYIGNDSRFDYLDIEQ